MWLQLSCGNHCSIPSQLDASVTSERETAASPSLSLRAAVAEAVRLSTQARNEISSASPPWSPPEPCARQFDMWTDPGGTRSEQLLWRPIGPELPCRSSRQFPGAETARDRGPCYRRAASPG